MSSRDDYERLKKLADFILTQADIIHATIAEAADQGVAVRESDIAFLKNRLPQIANAIERKAGSFLPPITGTLNLQPADTALNTPE